MSSSNCCLILVNVLLKVLVLLDKILFLLSIFYHWKIFFHFPRMSLLKNRRQFSLLHKIFEIGIEISIPTEFLRDQDSGSKTGRDQDAKSPIPIGIGTILSLHSHKRHFYAITMWFSVLLRSSTVPFGQYLHCSVSLLS